MSNQVDPLTLLKALSSLLDVKGGVKGTEEMEKIIPLMKDAKQLVSRCVYLNIMRVTELNTILEKFIVEGGWTIMNKWLVDAKSSENMALILEVMKLLQRLPLRIEHLKETSTPKLVKSLVKTSACSKVKSVASSLMTSWLGIIRGTSEAITSNAPDASQKKKKKSKTKADTDIKRGSKKGETKPPPISKAPSFAKFRKTGLEPDQEPLKKLLPKVEKTANNKRSSVDDDSSIPDKKVKSEAKPQKKITISAGFMDALNSVPTVPKRAVKRKAAKPKPLSASSPTNLDKMSPLHNASVLGEAGDFGDGIERHGKSPSPIPSPVESPKPKFNKYGKPMKSVKWAEESRLESIRYFEMEEGERVNVTTQNFKDMLHRERLQEREKMGGFHHKGDGSWRKPNLIDLPTPLVEIGCSSIERNIQLQREERFLQEIFLSIDMVPDSPAEPPLQPYEMKPPKIIPTDDPNDPGPLGSRSPSPAESNGTTPPNGVDNGETNPDLLKNKLREILETATGHSDSNGSVHVINDEPQSDNIERVAPYLPDMGQNGGEANMMHNGVQPPLMPTPDGYFPSDPKMMMPMIPPQNMAPPPMIPNDQQYGVRWGPMHNHADMNRPLRRDMPMDGPPRHMQPAPFHPPNFRGNRGNSWRPREPWRGHSRPSRPGVMLPSFTAVLTFVFIMDVKFSL